jgi:hypothetical protein
MVNWVAQSLNTIGRENDGIATNDSVLLPDGFRKTAEKWSFRSLAFGPGLFGGNAVIEV